MKKRILSLLMAALMLCAVMIAAAVPAFADNASCGDGVKYSLSNGTLTVSYTGSGKGVMDDYDDNDEAPWYGSRKSITKIVIGDGVKHVGDYAFCNYDNVTSISLGSSVESIGKYAFEDMDGLKGVLTIPASVKAIGERAFSGSTMEYLIMYGNVTDWGEGGAFRECDDLVTAEFKSGVTLIGNDAFYGSDNLRFVSFPGTLKTIKEDAFSSWYEHLEYLFYQGFNMYLNVDIEENDDLNCDYLTTWQQGVGCIGKKGEIDTFPTDSITVLTPEITTLSDGWYVCASELYYGSTRLQVSGNVHLVLLDGCGIVTSGGIHVCDGAEFTVSSTSLDEDDMGYIIVTGSPMNTAGIGGEYNDNTLSISIYGGRIASSGYDTGIGSCGPVSRCFINIFNGLVKAYAGKDSMAAAIGTTQLGDQYARVVIHGGTVEAHRGSPYGTDIGCCGYATADVYVSKAAHVTGAITGQQEYTDAIRDEGFGLKYQQEEGDYVIFTGYYLSKSLYIAGDNGAKNNGDVLRAQTATDMGSKVFSIVKDGNTNTYKIVSKYSGLVLGTENGGTANNVKVCQSADTGADSQRWVFEDADDGYVYIRNVTGKYMYLTWGTDRHVVIMPNTAGNTVELKFKLVEATPADEAAAEGLSGSVLSEGSLTVVVGIAAAVIFGFGGFFLGKKKRKTAAAGGAPIDETDDE